MAGARELWQITPGNRPSGRAPARRAGAREVGVRSQCSKREARRPSPRGKGGQFRLVLDAGDPTGAWRSKYPLRVDGPILLMARPCASRSCGRDVGVAICRRAWRGGGDYVERLTCLLFIKMADERTKAPYKPEKPSAG
jgi:hypothetical protein